MRHDDHLADEQILLSIEGELPPPAAAEASRHFEACWQCRARRQEFERAAADYVRAHQGELDGRLPPAAGPRALLKAQMARAAEESERGWREFFVGREFTRAFATSATVAVLVLGALLVRSEIGRPHPGRPRDAIVSIPDPKLTPGATLLVSRRSVCSEANVKNKAVPAALQRQVFEEYGIAGAEPRAYEVDYLVTPALGGADDIHNLWPHSYSATIWNARVKDALEDFLHDRVCDGSMDLSEAQREIATNWIDAYKKYFHTDRPLAEHGREEMR